MKKSCLILLLLSLLLLAGCGGTEQGVEVQTTPVSDIVVDEFHSVNIKGTNYVNQDDKTADLGDDELVVTWMTEDSWQNIMDRDTAETPDALAQTIKAWQETYGGGAELKIISVGYAEYNSYLIAQVAGGESPDVVPCTEDNYPLWPAMGLTVPLDEYANILYDKSVFDETLMDMFLWNGKRTMAIPLGANVDNTFYVIYNKKLFDDAGVKTPFEHWQDGNWNWTQFTKTAKEMTTENSYGFTGWGLFPYLAPYPMVEVDGTAFNLKLDDPKYIRYMTEVYNLYHVSKSARADWDLWSWREMMPNNTDAMCLGGFWHMKKMVASAERKETGADLRIAPLYNFDPTGESQARPYFFVLANGISASATNPVGGAEAIRLHSIINQRIKEKQVADGTDWVTGYLNEDELAMVEAYSQVPVVTDSVKGIGNCYAEMETNLTQPMFAGATELTVSALLESIKPILQAEITDFEALCRESLAAGAN